MTKTQNIGNKTSGMSEYLIIFTSDKKCFTNQVYMKKFYALAVFTLCALAANAQEKTMRVQNTDGTYTLTRVAEISRISFLSVADRGKAMIVSTVDSDPVTVLFEAQPEVTVSEGSLIISSKSTDTQVRIEINDISEIRFGEDISMSVPVATADIVCVLQGGSAIFKGITDGMKVNVCTIDGRSVPVPDCTGGELRLSRSNLGTGIFIVRIGTFTSKITL